MYTTSQSFLCFSNSYLVIVFLYISYIVGPDILDKTLIQKYRPKFLNF